jgi:hypothetical protein
MIPLDDPDYADKFRKLNNGDLSLCCFEDRHLHCYGEYSYFCKCSCHEPQMLKPPDDPSKGPRPEPISRPKVPGPRPVAASGRNCR